MKNVHSEVTVTRIAKTKEKLYSPGTNSPRSAPTDSCRPRPFRVRFIPAKKSSGLHKLITGMYLSLPGLFKDSKKRCICHIRLNLVKCIYAEQKIFLHFMNVTLTVPGQF